MIGEDEETKSFGAVLTCNQDSQTKLLRTSTSTCPVKAVRKLVSDLQKDTAKLFRKTSLSHFLTLQMNDSMSQSSTASDPS